MLTKPVCFIGLHQLTHSVINISNYEAQKKAIDHVTWCSVVRICGNDKHKLLVTGKSVKFLCFKQRRMDSLPVYYFKKNAWITSKIFEEWLVSWDTEQLVSSVHKTLQCFHCILLTAQTTILGQVFNSNLLKTKQ